VCLYISLVRAGDLGAVFGEAVRLARGAEWVQTGVVALKASNATSGVFLHAGSSWLQEAEVNMTLESTQGSFPQPHHHHHHHHHRG
jgi:hypothetical protein